MLQLGQRALTASEADQELFVDRTEELAAIERALALGFNVYVSGPRGSGKTSLLHQLAPRVHRGTVVSFARVDSLDDLVLGLAGHIWHPSVGLDTHPDEQFAQFMDSARSHLAEDGADRLEPIRDAIPRRADPGPLLLDNLRPRLRHELFGRQRDELWEIPLQWVVTGDDPQLGRPEDSFFEASVAIEPFAPDTMRELLACRSRGARPDELGQMQRITETLPDLLGPATPRRLLSTVRTVLLDPDIDTALERLRWQSHERNYLSGAAEQLLDTLSTLGPVHAGDERLLGGLGISRSRAVQILRELESVGLVRSIRDGRRKLYAPDLSADLALGDDQPTHDRARSQAAGRR